MNIFLSFRQSVSQSVTLLQLGGVWVPTYRNHVVIFVVIFIFKAIFIFEVVFIFKNPFIFELVLIFEIILIFEVVSLHQKLG